MPSHHDHVADVGRRIRILRADAGLTVGDLARQLSTSRRQVWSWERGRQPVPEGARRAIADVLGQPVTALVPDRAGSQVAVEAGSIRVGGVRRPTEPDQLLPSYLEMVYTLRGVRRGEPLSLRDEDLDALSRALGSRPEVIEERLLDLIACTEEEAADLRALIMRRRVATGVAGMAAGALALGGVSVADVLQRGDDVQQVRTVQPDSSADDSPADDAVHQAPAPPTTASPDPAPATTSTTAAPAPAPQPATPPLHQTIERVEIGEPLVIEREPPPEIGEPLVIEREPGS